MEQEMQVSKKSLEGEEDKKNINVYRNRFFKAFQIGEQVYLDIKLKKVYFHIGSLAKMAPQFHGPFNIIERIWPIAY